VNCPTEAEKLRYLLESVSPPVTLDAHLAVCAACRDELRGMSELVRSLSSAAPVEPGPDCLDDVALATLVDGAASDGALTHLASCAYCRAEAAGLLQLLREPAIAAAVPGADASSSTRPRRPGRRWAGIAGIAAAAATVLLVTRGDRPRDGNGTHRGATITASVAPAPLTPVGDVDSARQLAWRAVPGADRYRVVLFDDGGRLLLETELRDSSIVLPDSVSFVSGRSYLWRVDARTSLDRWSSSELIEFRVTSGSEQGAIPASGSAELPVSWSAGGRDSLRRAAPRLSDSALAREARARPGELRDALRATLALVVRDTGSSSDRHLDVARRLARAHADAWGDDFLVRQVARFSAAPEVSRRSIVWGDSMRRAGNAAFGSVGPEAAIALWRRSLPRLGIASDSAGFAATLGNIGAGYASTEQPDSAERYLGRALEIARRLGDHRVEGNALSELAGIRAARDPPEARVLYARAIASRDRVGDSRGLAADYNNLAGLARDAGELAEAQQFLGAALAINRRDARDEAAATNLVNLAALALLRGALADADSMYRGALASWRTAGRTVDEADALRGLGEIAMRRGDYRAAHTRLRAALVIYERGGKTSDALATHDAIARSLAAMGDLQGALEQAREAERRATRALPAARGPIVLLHAELAAQLNLRTKAEREYLRAGRLLRAAGDASGLAAAQEGRARLRLDAGDPGAARALLEDALRVHRDAEDRRGAALVRLPLADAALQLGDTTRARAQLAEAARELAALGDRVAMAAALGERASLESAAGARLLADSLFRAALALVDRRPAPEVSWRLHAGLGDLHRARGALDAAARELALAIADIERTAGAFVLPERRSGFLADKWDVYARLAEVELDRGRTASAFAVSERLHAGEMLHLLARGRVTSRGSSPELVAREQDLRRRIAELSERVSRADGPQASRGPADPGDAGAARESLLHAQEAYAELLVDLRGRAPNHASLVAPAPVGWRDVSRRLAPDEAFVEYLLGEDYGIALVITRDTLHAVRLATDRRALARRVEFVRGTLAPRNLPRLDSLWRAPLRQLHRDLIDPIEASGALRGRTRLVIVPHAELHYLPFAALLRGAGRSQFLVERHEIVIAPSASVWLALADRAPSHPTQGMLVLAPQPTLLPASREEARVVAGLAGPGTRLLAGPAASEAAFVREAPARAILHLATSGVLNKQNPLFSFVSLARSGTDDGRLEAHEVFGLALSARLVVLSACQTGLGAGSLADVPAGDDWVGLTRAFLSAGADRVLSSLWPVQDRATATLMDHFYRAYAERPDAGRSLALAQRALLTSPATAAPWYWAAFEVVGGR
jgi:CHAT domain-containing protein